MSTTPPRQLPYFERGLIAELQERDPETWSWSSKDLALPTPGNGIRAVQAAVQRLTDWGYLRIWTVGLGPGKGVWRRWSLHLNDEDE